MATCCAAACSTPTRVPYEPALRAHLARTLPPAQLRYSDVCELDTGIGQAFAEVAAGAIAASGPVDLICSHGQTVFHWVDGAHALGTLQLGQPAWIAERTGTPVVADVRARDITVGGHGAPLVSLMDVLLLRDLPGSPAALNLGGISNMTVLRHPDGPIAYDIGPSNALIDAAMRRLTDGAQEYDAGGRMGASGHGRRGAPGRAADRAVLRAGRSPAPPARSCSTPRTWTPSWPAIRTSAAATWWRRSRH